jgi:hypothetical protein
MAGNPGGARANQANRQTAESKEEVITIGNLGLNPPKVRAGSKNDTVLRYPWELDIDSRSDYVVFEFYKYMPPFGRGEGESLGTLTDNLWASGYESYNKSGVAETKGMQPSDTVKPIILYMPEDIQAQYGSRWGGAEFATGAVGVMRAMGGKGDLRTLVGNIPGSVKNLVYNETLKQINEYTGSSINLNQMLGAISGTILNPNTEMLYQGQDLRTFSLSFKMTPRTDKEAKIIRQICNTFKKASMPYIGGQAVLGAFKAPNLIKVPNVCKVSFMNGSNLHDYLPQYKLCAIAGVEVNYTPDGSYATVGEKGSPVATQLTVSFKETKILFGNDINTNEAGASY